MRILRVIVAVFALAACEQTPEGAKRDLERRKIPVTGEQLIKQTRSDDSRTARDLVVAGADPNAKTERGWTALMSAAYNGQADTVNLLIQKGADVNAEARGYSVLSAAVFSRKPEIVKSLLKAGADPSRKLQYGGTTPLAAAKSVGDQELVRLLTEAGAKQ